MAQHSLEKPIFACCECGKSYTRKLELNKHLDKKHGGINRNVLATGQNGGWKLPGDNGMDDSPKALSVSREHDISPKPNGNESRSLEKLEPAWTANGCSASRECEENIYGAEYDQADGWSDASAYGEMAIRPIAVDEEEA